MKSVTIEPTRVGDIPALVDVVDATGLFPSDLLPDMVTAHLNGQEEAVWLTAHADGRAAGLSYAIPEQMTDGTWNMLALAVHPELQGHGLGAALVAATEAALRAAGHRLLLVDTSGTDAFARTRAFYAGLGYKQEACIRDFWADGDDKVTFRKAL